MTVEPMSFDFSHGSGLVVLGPPGRAIQIHLDAGGYEPIVIDTTLDARGAHALGPEDVPARSGWEMSDVRGVHVVLPTAGGHATAAEWHAVATGRIAWLPAVRR